MAFERNRTLQTAEALRRQGRFEAAIAEYLRVLDNQPADWTTANILGDLYVRTGQIDRAVAEFTRIADELATDGFLPKAGAVYKKILKIRSDDERAAIRLAETAIRQGLVADAKSGLAGVAARRTARGDRAGVADVQLRLAELELRAGNVAEGLVWIERIVANSPAHRERVAQLACALCEVHADTAYRVVELSVGVAIATQDWDAAAADLSAFANRQPMHVRALMRLVEVCAEGGLDRVLPGARARLADAYLADGRGADARSVAEALLAADPGDPAHRDRLRRASALLGHADPDEVVRKRLEGPEDAEPAGSRAPEPLAAVAEMCASVILPEAFLAPSVLSDLLPRPCPTASSDEEVAGQVEQADGYGAEDEEEIDLGGLLDERAAPIGGSSTTPAPEESLGTVFRRFREEVSREDLTAAAIQYYKLALWYQERGDVVNAETALEEAVHAPALRFDAASRLGRLCRARGASGAAIEWFERAAEVSAPNDRDGWAVLYDLAEMLEGQGETARALAVLLELHVHAGEYRDLSDRLKRLTGAQVTS